MPGVQVLLGYLQDLFIGFRNTVDSGDTIIFVGFLVLDLADEVILHELDLVVFQLQLV